MSKYQHYTRFSPSTGTGSPDVWGIYEADTGSVQYVMACPETKKAALIDVVLNFDPRSARTSTGSAERVLDLVRQQGLDLVRILDTHPHADQMMAAAWLKSQTGLPNAIGVLTKKIAELWQGFYNLPDLDPTPHFDEFFEDGDNFDIGDLNVTVELSTGHTLGSISYFVGDAGFIHDTLMYPDSGSSRADFPGGSAKELWDSIQSILCAQTTCACSWAMTTARATGKSQYGKRQLRRTRLITSMFMPKWTRRLSSRRTKIVMHSFPCLTGFYTLYRSTCAPAICLP